MCVGVLGLLVVWRFVCVVAILAFGGGFPHCRLFVYSSLLFVWFALFVCCCAMLVWLRI